MTRHGQIAEYRDISQTDMSHVETLDSKQNLTNGRMYYLVHASPGYELAGSCARDTKEYYAVRFYLDGARHGQQYAADPEGMDKARARFRALSTHNWKYEGTINQLREGGHARPVHHR